MPRLFGYRIEPDFDIASEHRQGRVGWGILILGGICILYDLTGGPHSTEVLQASLATLLCYGANFYANRRGDLNQAWLWKAVIATFPLHGAYIALLLWSDKMAPETMTKALAFIPALLVGFGIESLLIDRIVAHFKPKDAK